MRAPWGKGVAYAELDGRGVVYIVTPAFFLHALDAETGRPLEEWGTAVPIEGFSRTGVVDLLSDLIADWDPWLRWGRAVRSLPGDPARARLHHEFLAPHRGQRGRHRRKLRRAGLQPDPPGERSRRHPRLRRPDGRVPLEVPRHSEAGRGSATRRGRTMPGAIRATSPRGRRCRPTPNAGSSTSRRTRPRWTSTGVSSRATTSSARASSPWMSRRESGSGTSRWSTTDVWNNDTPTAPVLMDVTVDGETGPRRLPGNEAGHALLLRPRDGGGDLADRGACGPRIRGPRRGALADAALSHQAGPVRPARPLRGRPDRLHARASRRGARGSSRSTGSARSSTLRSTRRMPPASGVRSGVRANSGARTSPVPRRPIRSPG